ncbi:MAG TPA: energy transducer TonB [Pyrinomonadaceae bacterium]|jgi:TonB family protein|nr:energy transducer TonB [Pyrinomonadaceae bacterium]
MKRSYFSIAAVLVLTVCCFAAARAQSAAPQPDEDRLYNQNEVDKKAQLLTKPRASSNGQCKRNASGTILFNLVMRRSGAVEIASVPQTSGCDAFDRSAYDAIGNIKFNPAEKDGQPVSVKMTITFTYTNF